MAIVNRASSQNTDDNLMQKITQIYFFSENCVALAPLANDSEGINLAVRAW